MKQTTLRKKKMKMLELLKNATDQCYDGILITNAQLDNYPKIVYVNDEFCHMTGYQSHEIIGKSKGILQGPKSDPFLLDHLRKELPRGHRFRGETINYRKDGSYFDIELDTAPVFDSEGKITHCIFIMKDISQQNAIQENKDTVINLFSQELKTPLTAMKGFVGILQNNLHNKPSELYDEYLSIINNEIDRVLTLNNKLLATTRSRNLGVQPNKKLSNLDDIVRQEILNIKVAATSHKVRRRGKIETPVNCDPERIAKVLHILLTNAVKYSPPGEQIFVNLKRDTYHAMVSIQDFGVGIAPEKQELLFKPITYTKSQSQLVRSGLNLFMASEIVQNHGGKIWMNSTEGEGSLFSFSLPLQ